MSIPYDDGIITTIIPKMPCVICHNDKPATVEYFRLHKRPGKDRGLKLSIVCRECESPAKLNKVDPANYKDPDKKRLINNHRQAMARFAIKVDVLNHYGNNDPKCMCCGESLLELLTMNHIGGLGSKHRKIIGNGGGVHFYRWLKDNGYPEGFNILCIGCNFADGMYGICPHQLYKYLDREDIKSDVRPAYLP